MKKFDLVIDFNDLNAGYRKLKNLFPILKGDKFEYINKAFATYNHDNNISPTDVERLNSLPLIDSKIYDQICR